LNKFARGRFSWLQNFQNRPFNRFFACHVSARELCWLLDGLSLSQRQAHPKVVAETVIYIFGKNNWDNFPDIYYRVLV
jgi:transposase